jgi:hypothetical protein
MEDNIVIIHAQTEDGTPVDVTVSYDALDVIWNRDKGTLILRVKENSSQVQTSAKTEMMKALPLILKLINNPVFVAKVLENGYTFDTEAIFETFTDTARLGEPECAICFDEEGSYGCVRPSHSAFGRKNGK